ncbi:MAG: MerR family DNA-binding transcriptional regulator, partial [Trichodesmium sp. St18_bin1]|nr:MerR family DNA-binding transcriptional regulator [Trichodesmium sp. St18_bin1]
DYLVKLMMMTNRFIKIGAAAELLGVSIDTLRKWELSGELIPDRKSQERDLNAGLNLAMAVSSTVTACGLDNADVARMKQE